MTAVSQKKPVVCTRCRRDLNSTAYEMLLNATRAPHCLRCALAFRPMLKRSLAVSLIVGTVLTAINQGNFLFSSNFQIAMAWKVPLTYAVPFMVTTVGGLLNARTVNADPVDPTG
jgi:hypothetical protein